MKEQTKIDLNKVSKENLIKLLNKMYQDNLESILLDIYHRLLHNVLTLDDLEDIGRIYNLDLNSKYQTVVLTLDEEEDND